VRDDSFLLVVHAGAAEVAVTLPGEPYGAAWLTVLDTAKDRPEARGGVEAHEPDDRLTLAPRSAVLLRAAAR
jgi:glycogen operon protein